MENLFWMADAFGPRVPTRRNHKLAAEWAMKQMNEWGLKNVHLEKWPFGYGWQIKHFYAAMESPVYASFTGFPLSSQVMDVQTRNGRPTRRTVSRLSAHCGRRPHQALLAARMTAPHPTVQVMADFAVTRVY